MEIHMDFAYWSHLLRAFREGFKPLTEKQFKFRFEICEMAKAAR